MHSTCKMVIDNAGFFGGSESLRSRVSATVCQKNDGYNYLTEVDSC